MFYIDVHKVGFILTIQTMHKKEGKHRGSVTKQTYYRLNIWVLKVRKWDIWFQHIHTASLQPSTCSAAPAAPFLFMLLLSMLRPKHNHREQQQPNLGSSIVLSHLFSCLCCFSLSPSFLRRGEVALFVFIQLGNANGDVARLRQLVRHTTQADKCWQTQNTLCEQLENTRDQMGKPWWGGIHTCPLSRLASAAVCLTFTQSVHLISSDS